MKAEENEEKNDEKDDDPSDTESLAEDDENPETEDTDYNKEEDQEEEELEIEEGLSDDSEDENDEAEEDDTASKCIPEIHIPKAGPSFLPEFFAMNQNERKKFVCLVRENVFTGCTNVCTNLRQISINFTDCCKSF